MQQKSSEVGELALQCAHSSLGIRDASLVWWQVNFKSARYLVYQLIWYAPTYIVIRYDRLFCRKTSLFHWTQPPMEGSPASQLPDARIGSFISIYQIWCCPCLQIPCLLVYLHVFFNLLREHVAFLLFAFQHPVDISSIATELTPIKPSNYEVSGGRIDLCVCVSVWWLFWAFSYYW